jgi:hypothetical protein
MRTRKVGTTAVELAAGEGIDVDGDGAGQPVRTTIDNFAFEDEATQTPKPSRAIKTDPGSVAAASALPLVPIIPVKVETVDLSWHSPALTPEQLAEAIDRLRADPTEAPDHLDNCCMLQGC